MGSKIPDWYWAQWCKLTAAKMAWSILYGICHVPIVSTFSGQCRCCNSKGVLFIPFCKHGGLEKLRGCDLIICKHVVLVGKVINKTKYCKYKGNDIIRADEFSAIC
eukprot:10427194-Ditylum_brightwellii.AAC.1